ncbi:energy transducer TonB [Massilia sp. IC2-476]|uniref:energy transducer TonB n=1 Tax=Massilia sp. IC2-476 TaxID=2887199 RepID=UPI001D10A9D1|nr:energy transducer TonB [Massilia sp. IC2-476]MCC2971641.1 energy transducer TonB [Massilia sp. IC2-476]
MKDFALALLAVAALPCASAQMMEGDTMVYPRDAAYPAGLAERGVQGRAVVRVTVGPAGKAAAAAITESSRSPELDKAALALTRSFPYTPPQPGVAPAQVLVPIRFSKDSMADLPRKTCADFNIDKAWFMATFPELQASDMEVVKMARDALIFTLPGPQQMPYAQHSSAVAATAIAACATQPREILFGLMQREAAKLPRKQ